MTRPNSLIRTVLFTCALLSYVADASGQTAPGLGAAQPFAVLGGSTVTNTGSSVIAGSVGINPGSAITGFPPGIVGSGTVLGANAQTLNAQNAVTTAFTDLGSQPCLQDLTGQDLGGLTLTQGVYCFSSSAQLTGTLTLNAQGNPNAVFIFKTGSTLTTSSGSTVALINSASECNVFWQVGSSATLGTSTSFVGNILAATSIAMTTGANLSGRALARSGAVTLDTNNVTAGCLVPLTALVIAPAVLPDGTVGVAYTQTLTVPGGALPVNFVITGGLLPAGLTLSPAGVISGVPTVAGVSNFSIRATDSNGGFADAAFALLVANAVPTLPQFLLVILALALVGVGYARLRTRARGR